MTEMSAMKTAVSLLHLPADARRLRHDPLPSDVATVLRIAAGDEEIARAAAQNLDRPLDVIRQAAIFYIEQILLHREADHYRVLGSWPTAAAHDLRRNMALLLSWLHPDKNPDGDRSVQAAQVTGAWDVLRCPERRTAYDLILNNNTAQRQPQHGTMPRPTYPPPHHGAPPAGGPGKPGAGLVATGPLGLGRQTDHEGRLWIHLMRGMVSLTQKWRGRAALKSRR